MVDARRGLGSGGIADTCHLVLEDKFDFRWPAGRVWRAQSIPNNLDITLADDAAQRKRAG